MVAKRKSSFKFSSKPHPIRGVRSVITAAITWIIILSTFYISSKSGGNGSIFLGLIGIITLALSIYGVLSAIKAFKEKDMRYITPIIGLISNGLLLILVVVLYLIGLLS